MLHLTGAQADRPPPDPFGSAPRQSLLDVGALKHRAYGIDDGVGEDLVIVLEVVGATESRGIAGGKSTPERPTVATHYRQMHSDRRFVGRRLPDKKLPDLTFNCYRAIAVDRLETSVIE